VFPPSPNAILPPFPSADLLAAPAAPAAAPPPDIVDDAVWHHPTLPLSAVYAALEVDISTAITDLGTPGDIIGDT